LIHLIAEVSELHYGFFFLETPTLMHLCGCKEEAYITPRGKTHWQAWKEALLVTGMFVLDHIIYQGA